MSLSPITYVWTGEALEPVSPFMRRLANKDLVVGEQYTLVEEQPRSAKSHAHFFAVISEAHVNLPEHLAERFPTAEGLRKYALIKAGYRDERTIVAASKAEALRLAAFIRPMDEFAIVTVNEAVVTVYTAKSQSLRAMGKADFQASKDAVLGIVAAMVGTTPDALRREAGRAA